jgi:hypothetical protein
MKKNRFLKNFYLLYLKIFYYIVSFIHHIFRNNRAYRKKLQLGALIISLSVTPVAAGYAGTSPCLSEVVEEVPIAVELKDTDSDGLYDYYEREVFKTDPYRVDTDKDGTPDGDEDHNADGTTNWEHQVNEETPLIAAIRQGQTEKAMVLLVSDAEDINAKDARGMTALMAAAEAGYTDIVELLIDLGADVTARDKNGLTSLEWALQGGHAEVAAMLR